MSYNVVQVDETGVEFCAFVGTLQECQDYVAVSQGVYPTSFYIEPTDFVLE